MADLVLVGGAVVLYAILALIAAWNPVKPVLRKLGRWLWPFVSRRRLRVAEQLAARALLGRRALAADKADLAAEIGRLNRTLADAEPVIRLHKGEAKRLEGRVRELEGRLECQADNHEADRAEWARARRRLEEQLAAADRDHAEVSGRLQDAEHAANLYQQHMARCPVADALDLEDHMKRVGDL